MAATAVTLTVTARAGGGYRIEFRAAAPGAKGKSTKADDIPPEPFQAGGPLDPDAAARTLGDRTHRLEDLHRLGSALATTFLSGDVGQAWRKAADQVRDLHRDWRANPQGRAEPVMRTYLLVEAAELQGLPWEICRIDDENVFFERALPVARALGANLTKAAPLGEWPVRVLAVIGADTGGLQPDREVRELCRRLRRHDYVFDCEVFDCSAPGADPDTVVPRLKAKITEFKPHILHFAGHASFDPAALQLGADAQTPGHWWRAEDISGFLNATVGWRLQFAFLNACRTERPPKAANSFARAFAVKGNALAIVTMCADVRGADAADYAASAYAALADGAPLDQAVTLARGALGPTRLAAYYAVVNTAAAPEPLLPSTQPAPDRRQRLELLDAKPGIQQFVDRVAHRRQVLSSITKGANAVLVTGDTTLGKTWFVQSCCRTLAWQGHPVIYCNLTSQKSWTDLLLTLLQGGDEPGLAPPIDPQLVSTLTQRLRAGGAAGLAGSDKAALAQGVLDALSTLGTKDAPLILALDHLETSEVRSHVSGDVPTIFLSFFRPIAQGDGRVRLLLSCVSPAVYANEQLSGTWAHLPLTPFPATELSVLIREMLLAKGPNEAQLAKAEGYLPQRWDADLSPRDLAFMCNIYWGQVRGGGNG